MLTSLIDSTAVSLLTIVPSPLASPRVARVPSVAPPNKTLLRLTLKSSSSSTMLSSLTVTVTVSLVSSESPLIVNVAPLIAV